MLATWSKNKYPTSKKNRGFFSRYSRCLFCAPGRLRVCPTSSSTTITIPPCVVSIRSGHLNFGSEAVERVTKGRSVGVEHVPASLLLKTWARVSGPPIHQDAGERGGLIPTPQGERVVRGAPPISRNQKKPGPGRLTGRRLRDGQPAGNQCVGTIVRGIWLHSLNAMWCLYNRHGLRKFWPAFEIKMTTLTTSFISSFR